jgi:hypothetical protein
MRQTSRNQQQHVQAGPAGAPAPPPPPQGLLGAGAASRQQQQQHRTLILPKHCRMMRHRQQLHPTRKHPATIVEAVAAQRLVRRLQHPAGAVRAPGAPRQQQLQLWLQERRRSGRQQSLVPAANQLALTQLRALRPSPLAPVEASGAAASQSRSRRLQAVRVGRHRLLGSAAATSSSLSPRLRAVVVSRHLQLPVGLPALASPLLSQQSHQQQQGVALRSALGATGDHLVGAGGEGGPNSWAVLLPANQRTWQAGAEHLACQGIY